MALPAGQALARGHNAAVVGFQQHQAVGAALLHGELQTAVGQHHAVAGLQGLQDLGMIEGQEGHLIGALVGKAQQQLHALGDLDGLFLHDTQTDLGAGQVLHDGDGLVQLLFHFTDIIDDTDEIRGRTVGEVQGGRR